MDKYDLIHALRKSLNEREEQIKDILMSGGIKDMEKYQFLMGEILHFIKHFLGLCGEAHPSVLVSGGALITWIGVYFRQITDYVRSMF